MLLNMPSKIEWDLDFKFTSPVLALKDGLLFTICKPITMSTNPPANPIINAAGAEPINHPKPANNSITRIISLMMCPEIIKGPAINPFSTESEMVTLNMGPGANAPDSPTKKEVAVNKANSIIKSHLTYFFKIKILPEYLITFIEYPGNFRDMVINLFYLMFSQ